MTERRKKKKEKRFQEEVKGASVSKHRLQIPTLRVAKYVVLLVHYIT